MTKKVETTLENLPAKTIDRLRNRAWLLRVQAYSAISLIVLLVVVLITIFSNHTAFSKKDKLEIPKGRDPYDYSVMEQRHNRLSDKLTELIEESSSLRQEIVQDNYGGNGKRSKFLLDSLEIRIDDLKTIKTDLNDRLWKDRANQSLEISRLKEERDQIIRDSFGKRDLITLSGDIAFRMGVLVLALYLSSLLFSTSKYLLRVADHLNSIADAIDLSFAAGIDIGGAIRSLTPHPIDFQLDDAVSIKTVKELLSMTRDAAPKE